VKHIVSVGMPAYNAEGTIEKAIDSILSQDYPNIELIVSDNASTDRTEAICRRIASQDRRVRYFRQSENVGVHNNYNFVFLQARGRYFKWASSNDCCHPTFLTKCVAALEEDSRAVVCCPRTVLVFADGREARTCDALSLDSSSAVSRYIEFRQRIKLNNVMNGVIRSESLRRTSLYRGYVGADINMMAELTFHGTFIELEEHLFYRSADPQTTARLMDDADAERYYRPTGNSRMRMQVWISDLNYLARAAVAPMTVADRARLIAYNLREMVRHRDALGRDIVDVLRSTASILAFLIST
jgi:glycosyltransferase involved in cell wall biosynthesis